MENERVAIVPNIDNNKTFYNIMLSQFSIADLLLSLT
jgi:hypothetical protein